MIDTNTSQGIAAHSHTPRLGQVMYRVYQATSAAERLLIGSPTPLVPHLPCWAGTGQSGLTPLTWMPCRHSLCRSGTSLSMCTEARGHWEMRLRAKQHLELSHSPLCKCLCMRACIWSWLPFPGAAAWHVRHSAAQLRVCGWPICDTADAPVTS